MPEIDSYVYIYLYGLQHTIVGGVIISFIFALGRWIQCIREYIKTGNLDAAEGSFFFGRDNWFYGPNREMKYYNNPWVVPIDIVFVSIGIAILAVIWPVSVIVIFVITYAKVARVRFKRKKEFIDKLAGEHA